MNKTTRIRRAPKLPSGDYYDAWEAFDSNDEWMLDEPEPVIQDDPAIEVVRPLLKEFGHRKDHEIDLLEALWRTAYARYGVSYGQWLAQARVIDSFTAQILDSPAVEVCNLNCVFYKLYSKGMLRLPGLVECFLSNCADNTEVGVPQSGD